MTTNAELIAEARLAAAGELSMAVLEQPGYHTGNQELFNRLADALEAVSVPVEVTERERLIADALLIAGALEEYEFEDVAADAAAVMNSLVDLLAAGFRAPAADGEAEWAETLVNDGEFEYTISGDCDGSNVKHWKRTPRRVIEAGKWQQHFPVESEEGAEQ